MFRIKTVMTDFHDFLNIEGMDENGAREEVREFPVKSPNF